MRFSLRIFAFVFLFFILIVSIGCGGGSMAHQQHPACDYASSSAQHRVQRRPNRTQLECQQYKLGEHRRSGYIPRNWFH